MVGETIRYTHIAVHAISFCRRTRQMNDYNGVCRPGVMHVLMIGAEAESTDRVAAFTVRRTSATLPKSDRNSVRHKSLALPRNNLKGKGKKIYIS